MGGHYVPMDDMSSSLELAEVEARTKAMVKTKVRRRLLPIIFVAALMCYLDRTNMSFAAKRMKIDLGFSKAVYGFGAGIFFLTYATFGIPSSLIVKRMGARTGLPLILVLWGLSSGGMAFIRNRLDFYLVRLLIGATEAGFFPAVIYYLTLWFAEEDMGLSYSIVMTSTAVSGIIGGPLAGVIITYCHNALGFQGWRWLFIVEAIPTIALGFIMLYYLDGGPSHARFLTPEEKDWLVARQAKQEANRKSTHAIKGLSQAIRLRWVWIIIVVWLLYSCGYYNVIFWMPLIIHDLGNYSDLYVGFLTAIPYTCSAVAMLIVARSSDRTRERRLHLALPAFFSAIGFFGIVAIHTFFGNKLFLILAFLSAAAAGAWAMFGPYWAIPTAVLTGDIAAASFALINSFGVLGGLLGPSISGIVWQKTKTFDTALVLCGVVMTLSGGLALCLRHNIGANADPSEELASHLPLAGSRNGMKYIQEENNGYVPVNVKAKHEQT